MDVKLMSCAELVTYSDQDLGPRTELGAWSDQDLGPLIELGAWLDLDLDLDPHPSDGAIQFRGTETEGEYNKNSIIRTEVPEQTV